MKKLFYFAACGLSLMVIACGGGKKQEVKTFAETFAGYVNNNQMDSIKMVYPEANFESFASIDPDSIEIDENDGIYRVSFAGGKWIDVSINEEGIPTVVSSNGVANLPVDKIEIAKKTGMINDSIPDIEKVNRLNDEDFFKWLRKNAQKNFEGALSVTATTKTGRMLGEGLFEKSTTISIKNNTNHDFSAKDYAISYTGVGANESEKGGSFKISQGTPGIDIKAGETKTKSIKSTVSAKKPTAVLKMPVEEYMTKYYTPTGNEYQEYLSSK